MIKSICTIAVALSLATGAQAAGDISWVSRTYDFGAFDEDTKEKTAVFRFVNTTGEPVAIIKATATCGCTTPEYNDENVAPGDTASITVRYDPTGRPGRFEKQVYVRTSASPERHRLTIRGTVIGSPSSVAAKYPVEMGPLRLRTGAAMFGNVYHGHEKITYLDGYNLSSDTIAPRVTAAPPYITARAVPEKTGPGELVTIELSATGDTSGLWGFVSDSLTIAPRPGGETYTLPLTAIFCEDFSTLSNEERTNAPVCHITVDRIVVEDNAGDNGRAGKFTITNHGARPLRLHRIYSADPAVTVSEYPGELPPGETCDITVTVSPEGISGNVVNTRVSVVTNDPDHPSVTLRVVGG